jgi:hypothetical protein
MSGVHPAPHRITLTRKFIHNDFLEEARVFTEIRKSRTVIKILCWIFLDRRMTENLLMLNWTIQMFALFQIDEENIDSANRR